MWPVFGFFSFFLLSSSAALVAGSIPWRTLNGNPPLVTAKGGFSGLFPDSSSLAYDMALLTSVSDLLLWCDLKLTKDSHGFCFPSLMLQNASDIDYIFPNSTNSYLVNGVQMQGYFSLDFNFQELLYVTYKQSIYSRTPRFDDSQQQIVTPDVILSQHPSSKLWLNIQYDKFFTQHRLNMTEYVINLLKKHSGAISYISSPEVGFLKGLRNSGHKARLVFQFLGQDETEPTTNQTYGSLLKSLTEISTFAAGILVPKSYIWPVDEDLYLNNHTSLVEDAHKEKLEVFAYGFANDASLPYDYNYDPVSEYLSFIDNGEFSVDGVISDFPVTPSAAIGCYAGMDSNATILANVTIISHEGTSGIYPGCTDKSYIQAVSDGADIIDCPVQMTSDGVTFCLGSINLRDRTNVAQSPFANRASDNPKLNIQNGILAYNLTWSEIQTLTPAMSSPFGKGYEMLRNPREANAGRLMRLPDFLAFAKNQSSVVGVMIVIENATYLAENVGLSVTDAVLAALSHSGYENGSSKRVLIGSSESAVLRKIKASGRQYELVYHVDEDVRDMKKSTMLEIRGFARSLVISKGSVFLTEELFLSGQTQVMKRLHSFNLTVYVRLFENEFVSQSWDFFSDPYVEIHNFVAAMGIDGLITDYPATANIYRRNPCLKSKVTPPYMQLVMPGGLLQLMTDQSLPPAEPPLPVLTDSDVAEPALPPVALWPPPPGNHPTPAPATTPASGQPALGANAALVRAAVLLLAAFHCPFVYLFFV